MKLQLLCMAGIILLSIAAEKSRQLAGDKVTSSRSRTERFTFLNCFDMSYGTMACVVKDCIKLYFYYMRAVYVQNVRNEATDEALTKALSRGKRLEEAFLRANEEGNAAARREYRRAKHIMAPLLASGWDFFETIYFGGALAEGLHRGTGTFVGAYAGGIIGEGRLGCLGFLMGSHLGSWAGGRIGLMVYDLGYGVQCLHDLLQRKCNSSMLSKDSSLKIHNS